MKSKLRAWLLSPLAFVRLSVGFKTPTFFFSIPALSACHSVLQGRGWAPPEQEADQAAGAQLLCSLAGGPFFLSLLFNPRMPRTMLGLGHDGMQLWNTQSKRDAGYSQPEFSTTLKMNVALCGIPCGTVEVISGKKCPCYWQWGHLSAPRSSARVSGTDWDFCTSMCSYPSQGNRNGSKFKLDLKYAKYKIWQWFLITSTWQVELWIFTADRVFQNSN